MIGCVYWSRTESISIGFLGRLPHRDYDPVDNSDWLDYTLNGGEGCWDASDRVKSERNLNGHLRSRPVVRNVQGAPCASFFLYGPLLMNNM